MFRLFSKLRIFTHFRGLGWLKPPSGNLQLCYVVVLIELKIMASESSF